MKRVRRTHVVLTDEVTACGRLATRVGLTTGYRDFIAMPHGKCACCVDALRRMDALTPPGESAPPVHSITLAGMFTNLARSGQHA